MSSSRFRPLSLVEQIAAWLHQQIRQGVWTETLPTERELCEQLSVSRPIVRRAIHQLAEEKVVQLLPSASARILIAALEPRSEMPSRRISLLIGDSSTRLGIWSIMAIDALRRTLYENGYQFDLIPDERLRDRRSISHLERIVERHPADFWILAGMSADVLRWFQDKKLPAVVMGSSFPGIEFASINDDLQGTSRHAAGVFLSLGHERIVHLLRQTHSAGEILEEQGFREAFIRHPDLTPLVVKHTGEPHQIRSRLEGLFSSPTPPTAILVSHAMDTIVVQHWLLEHQIAVPSSVSLISFQWEPFLEQTNPLPAWYYSDPFLHAEQLSRRILKKHRGNRSVILAPVFVKNCSVALPPAKGSGLLFHR